MQDRYGSDQSKRGTPPPTATRGNHSKRAIFRRTVFLMVMCGVVPFFLLGWKLWDISVVHHEEYQKIASNQQTLDMEVSASRGKIYDRNGNVMAVSATVYNLILSPRDLEKSVKKSEFTGEDGNVNQAAWERAVSDKQEQVKRDLMALLPELDSERLDTQIHATKYAYREVATKLEEEEVEPLRAYISENKTSSYLYLVPGTKRYYPYSGLASQLLGFVNDEGGAYGVEAIYDDVLEGTAGRVVTTRTAGGVEMYNSYAEYVDAENGCDVTLTVDATIQSYLEKAIEEGIQEFDVQNGAFGIAMNPQTGEVYAIASSPDFDPNNYSQVTDPILQRDMEANAEAIYQQMKASNTENLTDEELRAKANGQAYNQAVLAQWSSKAINQTYEPGSTFKAVVLSMALEEGLVSESDTFTCTGGVKVPGYPKTIHCSKRQGHGTQTLAEAVQNSCNPAFIEIGKRLGTERFYEYFKAFGYTEPTGIELTGEEKGFNWGENAMTNVDLAVASFGQRFTVTPVQQITAFSAVINGGKLMQPYLIQSVKDQEGNVIQSTEPTLVRQVISQETSRRATDILESVVSAPTGSGRHAYQAGYRIGGKTGSSETGDKSRTIVSFVGFAPADDPQVIVLLAFDKPQQTYVGSNWCTTGVYISGGNMSAPKAGPLLADILDYFGVEKEYTAEEAATADVSTPRVTGQTLPAAREALKRKNLECRSVGQGDTVTAQVPAAGANIPGGSTVILYLGDAAPAETGTVPNVSGMSYEAAKSRLEQAGFFMRASGVSTYYGNSTTANGQSVEGGAVAAIGTVIDVEFFNVVEDGAVDLE